MDMDNAFYLSMEHAHRCENERHTGIGHLAEAFNSSMSSRHSHSSPICMQMKWKGPIRSRPSNWNAFMSKTIF